MNRIFWKPLLRYLWGLLFIGLLNLMVVLMLAR